MGLRRDFLNVILQDLPDPTSTIDRSSERFDALMGGKTGNGTWGRYARNYGTSCAVTVTGWLLDAGAPPDMLNAPAPGGGGFVPGAHFARLMDGAKKRGWWKTATPGQTPDLRPGDIYMIQHGPQTEHTGAIVTVTTNADGSITANTADGGQISSTAVSGPDVARQDRTFLPGGGYKSKFSSGNLIGWIALGGDEPLDTAPEPPSSPPPDSEPPDTEPAPVATPHVPDEGTGGAPPTSQGTEGAPSYTPAPRSRVAADNTNLVMAAAAAGVAFLLGAASWYAWSLSPSPGLHAFSTWTQDGDTYLDLSGDLRASEGHAQEIHEALANVTGGRVIVDLSRVTYLGQEGMALLFGIYRLAPWGTPIVYRAGPWRRTLELLGRGVLTIEAPERPRERFTSLLT